MQSSMGLTDLLDSAAPYFGAQTETVLDIYCIRFISWLSKSRLIYKQTNQPGVYHRSLATPPIYS